MRPDCAQFASDVNDGVFQAGVDKQMWGIHDHNPAYPNWPVVIVWVQAAPKHNKPDRYFFRFDLNGYPSTAPTACPWDIERGNRLVNNQWPRGRKFVNNTFNYGWNQDALYAPCDRIAMAGHEAWREQFPELWWSPDYKVTVYLNFLHHLLNSSDYVTS